MILVLAMNIHFTCFWSETYKGLKLNCLSEGRVACPNIACGEIKEKAQVM